MTTLARQTLRLSLETTRGFACMLAAVLLLTTSLVRDQLAGDIAEYSLLTIAIANHGTPDIRATDIAEAQRVAPKLEAAYTDLEKGIARGGDVPRPGFHRDKQGNTQAIHFFAYSALAAVPYKVLDTLGVAQMKCFKFVNAAMLFVLGLALRRFFNDSRRALVGLALYVLCGGLAYANWTSPESMSASALLAGLLLCASAAPLAGGALIGLAATQNPSIVLVLALLPVIVLCRHWRPGMATAEAWNHVWHAPVIGGLVAGVALFATNPLFNLYAFGVPSIIAVGYTLPELGSWSRLHSVFFDLSQGMFLAIPAVAALSFWLALDRRGARGRILLLCALVVVLGMTLPALVVTNWNSGAAGVMRYSFWAAMPLLFVLLWQMREQGPASKRVIVGLLLFQAVATVHMVSYPYTRFSPLARLVMLYAPAAYNPEPEIFYERTVRTEVYVDNEDIFQFTERGQVRKTMYNLGNQHLDERLCGEGNVLATDNSITATADNWRYINGKVRCKVVPGYHQLRFNAAHFGPGGILGDGWSPPQFSAREWTGAWSVAPVSTMRIALPPGPPPRHLFITGFYHEGAGHLTRVTVNGKDYGWVKLDERTLPFDVPPAKDAVTVKLEHQPFLPPPSVPDQRHFGFFLRKVAVLQ